MPRAKSPPDRLKGLDLSPLIRPAITDEYLRDVADRASARVTQFQSITVAERFAGFKKIGFRPHGLYVPSDPDWAAQVRASVLAVGRIPEQDERWLAYAKLQEDSERWQLDGVPGAWTGQQAVCRSAARFRIVAWGRRGGKTFLAAHEALAVALARSRAMVWLTAPISKLVSRCWDIVLQLIDDRNIPTRERRNNKEDRVVVLENGSRIEGISLENVWSAAGAAVDFAVIDEAAQLEPDAWYRGVAPTLADRNGQALIISSWESEEGFFAEQARRAQDSAPDRWALFMGESWNNFFAFPQGRQTETLRQYEDEMEPTDFLEQFGAIPAAARNLVYPQFKTAVHVGDYPFNPNHPVQMAVDPSSGANEYAVVAVQDYGDETHVIDEYAVVGVMAEDVMQAINRKPWRQSVTDCVIDSASPVEIERWVLGKYPAFGVPEKPEPATRFPIYRRLLRDPVRFRILFTKKVDEQLEQMGLSHTEFEALPINDQRKVLLAIEELFAPHRISPEDTASLKRCAHLFINRSCVITIDEHLHYTFKKHRPGTQSSVPESPRKWKDHCLDALGYWAWTFKRHEFLESQDRGTSYLRVEGDLPLTRVEQAALALQGQLPREPLHRGFLTAMRSQYAPRSLKQSLLKNY